MSKKDPSLWEKSGSEPFLRALLIGLLVMLVTLFSSVMFCETCEGWVGERLGLHTKNKILTFLGIGMGGVLLALQALMSYKRAKAMEDTANAQAEAAKAQAKATEEQAKANQNTEQGQRQERLKNAIEHLGHDKDSVRLGGAYELFHLAEDTAEDTKDLRQTVLDILCAHIRRTTGEVGYQEKHKLRPSEEIQSLLTLLFVQEHEVFKGLHINLQGSWLNGADLREARLQEAVLTRTHLRRAHLEDARLQGTHLVGAFLQGAELRDARLQGAKLMSVFLQGAGLWDASLQGAKLVGAFLQGAKLVGARLQGAELWSTFLQGAELGGAFLQGAELWRASLQGTNLLDASLQGVSSQLPPERVSFAVSIKTRLNQETDLSGGILVGGLSREDVDSFVKGLSDERAKNLRERLEPHIGKPVSHELPENSGAITGAYTAGEAEQWIAEYEKAMSEVPEASAD